MIKKLGGEYELKNVEIKTSTFFARKMFLELILDIRLDVVTDLTKLFNIESIPSSWQKNQKKIDFCTNFFLSHTKDCNLYSIDTLKFGFDSDIRHTPLLAYFDFIFKNQSEFDVLRSKKEDLLKESKPFPKSQLINDLILLELIPNWKTLQTKSNSGMLCETLIKWAEKWNLTNEWCLDFALDCLRNCKTHCIDKLILPNNYSDRNDFISILKFNEFCKSGSSWNESLIDLIWRRDENFGDCFESEDLHSFQYTWKQIGKNGTQEVFKIVDHYNPFISSADEFRQRVEENFWTEFFTYYCNYQSVFIGNMKSLNNELENFQNRIDVYISKNESKVKLFANKSVTKMDGDKHFIWLIEYLIPPTKNYINLAKQNTVSRKAVESAIKNVRKILGLSLRKSSIGGRPKGVKDSSKRRRISG